jgi:hypothetical protein
MNSKHLKDFFGIEFPDFCTGYYSPENDFKPYAGNSILEVVDPVDEISSILNYKDYKFNFNFSIGFSKSTFNKMLKNYNNV